MLSNNTVSAGTDLEFAEGHYPLPGNHVMLEVALSLYRLHSGAIFNFSVPV
jgi:hypothetical protein